MTDETVTARTMRLIRNEIIEECALVIGNMRQSEAGLFTPECSGQRGQDRSDALYDAYRAIKALTRDPVGTRGTT